MRPQTSLVDSKESKVMGQFVLTKGIAPVFVDSSQNEDPSPKPSELTGIFEYPHHSPVFRRRFPRVPRITDRGIETAYDDGVLQRDGDTGQWSFEIDVLDPSLGTRVDHHLGKTIGPGVGLDGELAIAAKDIDGLDKFLVNSLDKLFD